MVEFDRQQFDRDGYCIVPGVLSDAAVESLRSDLQSVEQSDAVRTRSDSPYAIRNLLSVVPTLLERLNTPRLESLIRLALSPAARVVRAIYFDKTPESNWKVAWHQDLSISVCQRRSVEGFGPWSLKAGVVHVQPPMEILERMVTVRLHLDDCGEKSGPLLVVPGSHAGGRLTASQVSAAPHGRVDACVVPAGGAVVMRPLLLHASRPMIQCLRRRVLHLELSEDSLPDGLEWATSISIGEHTPCPCP